MVRLLRSRCTFEDTGEDLKTSVVIFQGRGGTFRDYAICFRRALFKIKTLFLIALIFNIKLHFLALYHSLFFKLEGLFPLSGTFLTIRTGFSIVGAFLFFPELFYHFTHRSTPQKTNPHFIKNQNHTF